MTLCQICFINAFQSNLRIRRSNNRDTRIDTLWKGLCIITFFCFKYLLIVNIWLIVILLPFLTLSEISEYFLDHFLTSGSFLCHQSQLKVTYCLVVEQFIFGAHSRSSWHCGEAKWTRATVWIHPLLTPTAPPNKTDLLWHVLFWKINQSTLSTSCTHDIICFPS